MIIVWLLIGLGLLVGGAELLVRGASRLALALRIPVIVVALTVVAFGTSFPELMVSVIAAMDASTDMALANVNGSNIANIALVLGTAALVRPLPVSRQLLRRDVPFCVGVQLLLPLLLMDGVLSRLDGLLLLVLGVAYNLWLLRDAVAGRAKADTSDVARAGSTGWSVIALFLGIGLLYAGAKSFVGGAVGLAAWAGLDERVIGLSVLALGTSAPEVATATMASRRGESDMAVGNSIGSNILNVVLVLGVTAMVFPIRFTPGAGVDLAVAAGLTLLLLPLALSGLGIGRALGGALVVFYLGYLASLPFVGVG